MRRSALPWLDGASRVLLGFVFLLAAAGKFRNPVQLWGGIMDYQLVDGWTALWGALVLPGIELTAALALLTGWQARAGALVIGGQLLLFMAAMLAAIWRKLDLNCGCMDMSGTDLRLAALGPLGWDLLLTALALGLQALSDPAWTGKAGRFSKVFALALALWACLGLLGNGAPWLRNGALALLAFAALAWLARDLPAALEQRLDLRPLLWRLLASAPLFFLSLYLLNREDPALGWGTVFRDVLLALPAAWVILRKAPEGG